MSGGMCVYTCVRVYYDQLIIFKLIGGKEYVFLNFFFKLIIPLLLAACFVVFFLS